MITVPVETSNKYDVIIGNGIISHIGKFASKIQDPCVAVIISDSNVWPLYGQVVEKSMQQAGYTVIHYTFPAGETSKNTNTYFSILEFLAINKITRSDLILALGGGVTGDMAGFAAATYLRGISYIQIPTSLLAMVDSSVGGKTAIDLPAGKNLVGAFYQPKLVLCDIDVLKTLPRHYFTDGCAEVIKYAILFDPELFEHLKEKNSNFDAEYVISRCVSLKQDVVSQDEFDTGKRQLLNLGHTFGHTIEKLSDFSITHGFAVSAGIMMAAKVGVYLKICDHKLPKQINDLLTTFDLPVDTSYDPVALMNVALNDKKRFGQTINLIIPQKIGCCIIHKLPVAQLESVFKAGK